MATTEAFSRVRIDEQLRDVGWDLTDGHSVRFEYTLADGTRADYVLSDRHGRAMAALEAKRPRTTAAVATRPISLSRVQRTDLKNLRLTGRSRPGMLSCELCCHAPCATLLRTGGRICGMQLSILSPELAVAEGAYSVTAVPQRLDR